MNSYRTIRTSLLGTPAFLILFEGPSHAFQQAPGLPAFSVADSLLLAAAFSLMGAFLALHQFGARRVEVAAGEEHHAALLLESVGEGVLSVRENGTIAFANQSAQTLLGYRAKELLGRPARELLQGCDPDCGACRRDSCLLLPALSGGEAQHWENEPMWRKDGSTLLADCSCSSISSGGKRSGAVLSFRDMSERKETQERLRVQGAALEAAANSVIIVDPQQKITWVNRSFSLLTGYSRDEVIGCTPEELSIWRLDEKAQRELWESIAGKRVWQGELSVCRKDGAPLDHDVTITPVQDEQGEVTQFIWIMLDVTERKRVQEALLKSTRAQEEANRLLMRTVECANQLAVKAERASAAKSEFLANMSHEIRTSMNAIIGASHLLRGTKLSPQQKDCLQTLMVSADLLTGIINDVLDFSKIEAGKLEIDRVEFAPQEVIGELLSVFAIRAEEKGLELRAELDPQLPRCMVGDPMRLAQILNNLLSNALKFTRHGYIEVSVQVLQKTDLSAEVQFSVRDTGIGVLPQDRANLFQAFTLVDGSITRSYGGTGLGLAICKRLATMMNGEIWCESTPGLGSTFSFRLAFRLVPERRKAERPRRPLTFARFRQERILLVEDNVFNQKAAVLMLERGGLEVTLACNGAEALEMMGRLDFDMVLMDIRMPVMDGLTAARAIRKLRKPGVKSLPILAVSANAMENDVKASLDAGMNAHITKPFTPETLYGAIAQWLPGKRGAHPAKGAVHPAQGAESLRQPAEAQDQAPRHPPSIDLEAGLRQTGGDRKLYDELLRKFELEYCNRGEEIRGEVGSGNREEAARLAHSVKGIAGVLAAGQLHAAAQRLEQALRGEGDPGEALTDFEEELERAVAFMGAL